MAYEFPIFEILESTCDKCGSSNFHARDCPNSKNPWPTTRTDELVETIAFGLWSTHPKIINSEENTSEESIERFRDIARSIVVVVEPEIQKDIAKEVDLISDYLNSNLMPNHEYARAIKQLKHRNRE
jgi:hypothetical protein